MSEHTPRILAFAASLRTGSYNKRLVRVAAEAVRVAGAVVTLVELNDYPMPIFNEDDESAHGLPETAKALKKLFVEHDGFLLASPEYNSSFTPLFKNTIDWVSRTEAPHEPALVAFSGKTAALLSASPGGLGGIRGLVHVRSILSNIGVVVLPKQVSIPDASDAFNLDGALTDASKQQSVEGLARQFVELTRKLAVR
ncbi:MAG TPA: NAD(P)H-dependent oxidoreductase [Chthoniobacteraceae bacterium]|nr:NAD(P)H-dependent oxidoreductase [Chthoniobacteraceae bacterium]